MGRWGSDPAAAHGGGRAGWGGHTDDPTVAGRLEEPVSSQLPWLPALVGTLRGDSRPLLLEEGQKESSTQHGTIEERGPHLR